VGNGTIPYVLNGLNDFTCPNGYDKDIPVVSLEKRRKRFKMQETGGQKESLHRGGIVSILGLRTRLVFVDCWARALARAGVGPTAITVTGLGITLVGSLLVASERLLAGAAMVGVGSLFDALDGAAARASGKASARGELLDSASDRIGETAMWAALAYHVSGRPLLVVFCVLALGSSLLISYLRAKAEIRGLEGKGGWMGRAERVILYVAGVGSGYIAPMLWAMTALTIFTVFQRFRQVWIRMSR
jgi:CDP-diacylglycerol--glycerol-3-phosphate 3-phosphatidyltransferase